MSTSPTFAPSPCRYCAIAWCSTFMPGPKESMPTSRAAGPGLPSLPLRPRAGHRTTGPSGHRRSGRLAAATLFDCSSVVLRLSGSEPSARPGTRWSDDRQAGRPPVVSGKPAESAPAGGARRADRTGSSARSGVPSRHARSLVHAIRSPRAASHRMHRDERRTAAGPPPPTSDRPMRTPNDVRGPFLGSDGSAEPLGRLADTNEATPGGGSASLRLADRRSRGRRERTLDRRR